MFVQSVWMPGHPNRMTLHVLLFNAPALAGLAAFVSKFQRALVSVITEGAAKDDGGRHYMEVLLRRSPGCVTKSHVTMCKNIRVRSVEIS